MNPFVWGFHKAGTIAWNLIEAVIRKLLGILLSFLHVKWSENQWSNFFQFMKFAMVGVTNAAVSYSVNVMVLYVLKYFAEDFQYDYVAANILAFLLSVLWSYYWNSRKVFMTKENEERSMIKTLMKTYASYAFTGIVVNNILATLWIWGCGISKFISPLLNIPFTMPINYLMNKKWAYSERPIKARSDRE